MYQQQQQQQRLQQQQQQQPPPMYALPGGNAYYPYGAAAAGPAYALPGYALPGQPPPERFPWVPVAVGAVIIGAVVVALALLYQRQKVRKKECTRSEDCAHVCTGAKFDCVGVCGDDGMCHAEAVSCADPGSYWCPSLKRCVSQGETCVAPGGTGGGSGDAGEGGGGAHQYGGACQTDLGGSTGYAETRYRNGGDGRDVWGGRAGCLRRQRGRSGGSGAEGGRSVADAVSGACADTMAVRSQYADTGRTDDRVPSAESRHAEREGAPGARRGRSSGYSGGGCNGEGGGDGGVYSGATQSHIARNVGGNGVASELDAAQASREATRRAVEDVFRTEGPWMSMGNGKGWFAQNNGNKFRVDDSGSLTWRDRNGNTWTKGTRDSWWLCDQRTGDVYRRYDNPTFSCVQRMDPDGIAWAKCLDGGNGARWWRTDMTPEDYRSMRDGAWMEDVEIAKGVVFEVLEAGPPRDMQDGTDQPYCVDNDGGVVGTGAGGGGGGGGGGGRAERPWAEGNRKGGGPNSRSSSACPRSRAGATPSPPRYCGDDGSPMPSPPRGDGAWGGRTGAVTRWPTLSASKRSPAGSNNGSRASMGRMRV